MPGLGVGSGCNDLPALELPPASEPPPGDGQLTLNGSPLTLDGANLILGS